MSREERRLGRYGQYFMSLLSSVEIEKELSSSSVAKRGVKTEKINSIVEREGVLEVLGIIKGNKTTGLDKMTVGVLKYGGECFMEIRTPKDWKNENTMEYYGMF